MEGELEPLEDQVLAMIAEGERRNLEAAATQDMDKLEEILDDTRVCVRERRREIGHSLVVMSQYNCLVQGLAGLVECGQERVDPEARLLTKNVGDLQSHLQSYKLFFCRLANHLIVVEQVAQNVPEPIVAHSRDAWLALVKDEVALQSRALLHGVRMETALQAWTEFEADHSLLMKEMEALSSAVPSFGLLQDTQERLTNHIGTFQRIRSSLDEKQPLVDEALRNGKALLTTVSSLELEGQLSTLEEGWLSLNNRVNHELHRLETLLQLQTRFQRESQEVGEWLETAESSLRYWELESVSLPSTPETSGNQLSLFLEFCKEVDSRCCAKTLLVGTGSQLLGQQQAEGGALRARLAQLEQVWAHLVARLPDIQEKLHQLQMERLPSRRAMAELSGWMSGVDRALQEDQAPTQALSSRAAARLMLQKHKNYQTEMGCRQLTVDCVNQSVLQISSLDVESDRYEKTEFAESLGALNSQWERLSRDVHSKVLHLESLLESWTEYERIVLSLDSWFEAQGERLRKNMKAYSHTSVLRALTHCQELSKELTVKEIELERLRQIVPLATGSSARDTPLIVMEKLDQLSDSRRRLGTEANQLGCTLASRLQLWTTYGNCSEQVNGNIVRARYSLDHCRPLSSSLEAVGFQVESLQVLKDTMECSEESWRDFQEASRRLTEECRPLMTLRLEHKCEDTHSRWARVNQDIAEQLGSARAVFLLWQRYYDVYRPTLAKVRRSEEGCGHLLEEISVEDSSRERLQSRLVETQGSLSDLRALQEDISRVCEAAEELARRIDSSSSAALQSDSRYLSGKVSHLERLLTLKIPDIQGLMEQHEEFRRCLHTLETLVNESEEVLKSDDSGTEGVDQARMETVKCHLLKLSGTSLHLETLRHLSHRLPLSEPDYRRVQDLNRRWHQAHATARDRCSQMQRVMLHEESFGHKCERWRRLLEKVEEGLLVDIAGSYEGLKEQQETHQLLQVEVSIAQQILHCVVSEALNLIPGGNVQDSTFALNLSALKERWRGLLRRVQQRQDTIRTLANQWRRHNDSAAKLRQLLTGTSNRLRATDGLNCYSLGQLWALTEEVKHQERNLGRHASCYALTLEAGRELLSAADGQTRASLEGQRCQLQEAWESTNSQLKEKRIELTNIEQMCDRCGEEVTTLALKLREFRADAKRALPRSSEDLQREQSKVQVTLMVINR
uniref:nesprin-2-like n=1 Tax=Pristiophorus japonicus TaxID=55135 RepID=UPI00398F5F01